MREHAGRRAGDLTTLAERYDLSPDVVAKLELLVNHLAADARAPTSIRDPAGIVDQHIADSLVALELDALRAARRALDLGSGAGIPGLPLAAALPDATFVLLESVSRKCEFLRRTIGLLDLSNIRVVHARAEAYADGLGRHDVVTVRAVAALDVTAEYAAPLLRVGGTLVAWGGRRSDDAETAAARAAARLGLSEPTAIPVDPFPGARHRHLNVMSKVMETPARFPRRPGVAAKRPLGGTTPSTDSSDRRPR